MKLVKAGWMRVAALIDVSMGKLVTVTLARPSGVQGHVPP